GFFGYRRVDGFYDPLAVGRAEQFSSTTGRFQSVIYNARHDNGVFCWHADHRWFDELSRAVDDRRARYGVSTPERVRLLDDALRRHAALFQLPVGSRVGGRRFRARCRLVCIFLVNWTRFIAQPQHRLLDSW